MKIVLNNSYGGFYMSDEAIKWLNDNSNYKMRVDEEGELEPDNYDYFSFSFRTSDALIKCVETLKEKASTDGSCLEVMNIDETRPYLIRIYDGAEYIDYPDIEHHGDYLDYDI